MHRNVNINCQDQLKSQNLQNLNKTRNINLNLIAMNKQTVKIQLSSQNYPAFYDESNEDLKQMMDLSGVEEQTFSDPQVTLHRKSYSNNLQFDFIDSTNHQEANANDQHCLESDQSNDQGLLFDSFENKQQLNKFQGQIKQILPSIHSHLIQKYYSQYQLAYQQRLSKYKDQLTQDYKDKISKSIEEMKQNINSNLNKQTHKLSSLKNDINAFKGSVSNKQLAKDNLSINQQQILVNKTVDQIFQSEKLLRQIKEKLKPKIQQRVRFILIRDLEKQLMKCQNEIQDKIAQEREEFKLQRQSYWEQQAEHELRSLAHQFEQLKGKKSNMESIVKQKHGQKQEIMKKYHQSIAKSKQIKQLQKSIKILEDQIKNAKIKENRFKKTAQNKNREIGSLKAK